MKLATFEADDQERWGFLAEVPNAEEPWVFQPGLLARGIEPEGKNVVILGAGGASRAVSFILADRGARLVILNRLLELDWAKELAGRILQMRSSVNYQKSSRGWYLCCGVVLPARKKR